MSTLATLTALPPMQSEEPSPHTNNIPLSSFLPSIQGQGPIASAMRIFVKLRNHSWLPTFVTEYLGRELTNSRKKDEELKGKAVKVIDLLQHAAELGHTDALYTLGQVSLVSRMLLQTFHSMWLNKWPQFPPNSYFPTDPTTAYNSFQSHADLTGNASSQALVGFFHSTGYHSVVPIDQAKAQLYLTFAGHGNHKGAQMALGYRYWSGISVAESCLAALDWYEDASEQSTSTCVVSAFIQSFTLPQR